MPRSRRRCGSHSGLARCPGSEVRCQSRGRFGEAGKARRRGIVGAIPRRSNAASVVETPPNLVTDFGFGTRATRGRAAGAPPRPPQVPRAPAALRGDAAANEARVARGSGAAAPPPPARAHLGPSSHHVRRVPIMSLTAWARWARSEGHTSELQTRVELVCRLLLEQ